MSASADPLIVVLIGPGGTGKGTVAERLIEADESLWLSRSWTTRSPREGEADDAYVFVDRSRFEAHAEQNGFLEWAEFLGNLYGTPVPQAPPGHDVLLEIELEGAIQIAAQRPDALVILLAPPSEEAQASRLRNRGDSEEHVQKRLSKGREELSRGRAIAHHEVVNHQVEQAVGEVLGILDARRQARVRLGSQTEE